MIPDLYLVRVRHSMDDLPVFISNSEAEAMDFARETTFDQPADLMELVGSVDCSTPICIDVVRFHEGRPVEATVFRNYDDEPEESLT